jgi:type IV secretory pathway VirD2 relaxase
VVVKARVVKLNPQRRARGDKMPGKTSKAGDAHPRYLERDGVTRDGEKGAGVTKDGKILNIAGDYIAHGIRHRASKRVTRELGHQSELEVARKLASEVDTSG